MAPSLKGKTAIVTGAGSGINFCFARLLLQNQCNVVLADLTLRPEAEEIVSEYCLNSSAKAKAVFQETDVQEWEQLERMFAVATQHFGGVDIVCPGAGVFEPPFSAFWHPPGAPPSRDTPHCNTYASLSINLIHPIRTTQLAISHFLSHAPPSPTQPKCVIHISSIAGQTAPFLNPIYNATKHGVNGFVRSLAPLEEMKGIRVAAVAPGVIKTPLWTDNPEKMRLVTEADVWVTPEYVAEVMMMLCVGGEVETVSGKGHKGTCKVEGGLVLEVAKGRVREVKAFMDEGPMGEGNTVRGMEVGVEEVRERLQKGWGEMGDAGV